MGWYTAGLEFARVGRADLSDLGAQQNRSLTSLASSSQPNASSSQVSPACCAWLPRFLCCEWFQCCEIYNWFQWFHWFQRFRWFRLFQCSVISVISGILMMSVSSVIPMISVISVNLTISQTKLFERLRCVLSKKLYLVPHTVPMASDLEKKWSQPGELESWNPPNPKYDDSQNQNQHLGLTAFY